MPILYDMTNQAPTWRDDGEYPEPEWTLGERIRKCRRLLGLEQAEFGALLGVSKSLVSKWEGDHREPRLHELWAIERVSPVPRGFLTIRSRCNPAAALRDIPRHDRIVCNITRDELPRTVQTALVFPPARAEKAP